MTRTIWRRAHQVRLPERLDTRPHVELYEAYLRDQYLALTQRVAADIDREFQIELR